MRLSNGIVFATCILCASPIAAFSSRCQTVRRVPTHHDWPSRQNFSSKGQRFRPYPYRRHSGNEASPTTTRSLPTSFAGGCAILPQPTTESLLRGCAVLMSIAILLIYHVQLLRGEKNGTPTWRSVQADTRESWSRFVRETEGWLYAVQTLRNAITANTFLATTVLSVLTLISGKLWEMVRAFPPGIARKRLVVQFTSVALCMLTSAYEFLQSARLMTHAGFMFPVAKGTKVDAIMRKSQSAQWLGLRWLYISLSAILWTIGGEQGFLLSSLALIQFFRRIDRVPVGVDQQQA